MAPNAVFHLMESICILFDGNNYMEIYMFLFHMAPNAFSHRVDDTTGSLFLSDSSPLGYKSMVIS